MLPGVLPSAPHGRRASGPRGGPGSPDRQLLALAAPALGALVAEPLFVLVDTAIVGRLGTPGLAGLALASSVLVTLVGVFVFLAYATTATVGRRSGAGDERGALAAGLNGAWLALLLGAGVGTLAWTASPGLVRALGASADVVPHAVAYLRASAPGLPGMLVVLAATGALRGRRDLRTPLVVAVLGAATNAVLDVLLVHGVGLGVAGSGLGTAITQTAMAAVLVAVLLRGAPRDRGSVRPAVTGVLAAARAGGPLLLRTVALRLAILATVVVAASLGDVALAAHHVVAAVWSLAAYALDALAIAAQALVGRALGAGDGPAARAVCSRAVVWGAAVGVALGLATAGSGWWLTSLITVDGDVRVAAVAALAVAGCLMPLAGVVYVLDGVLIGAGDGRYLALAGVLTLAAYAPALVAVRAWAPDGPVGLTWLWLAFAGVFMLSRALTTAWRARGGRWVVLGSRLPGPVRRRRGGRPTRLAS